MNVLQSEIATHPVTQSLFNAAAQQFGTMTLHPENVGRMVEFNLLIEWLAFVSMVNWCGKFVSEVKPPWSHEMSCRPR